MRLKHPDEYAKISCDLCSFVTVNEQRLQAHKEDHRKGLIVQVEGKCAYNNVNVNRSSFDFLKFLYRLIRCNGVKSIQKSTQTT